MKKHLIAAAVAAAVAAPAMAQNVELFGQIDASVSAISNAPTATGAAGLQGNPNAPGAGLAGGAPGAFAAGTAMKGVTAMTDGQIRSSMWGMKVNEDLGGGNKALIYLEGDVVVSNGLSHSSGMFRRGAYAGLSNASLGELTFGLRLNPVIATNGALMPVSGNGVSTLTSGGMGFSDFYTKNAITYTTPKLAGLTIQGQWGLSNDSTDSTEGSVKAASGAYELGGLTLRAAWQQRSAAAGGNAVSGAHASSGGFASTDKKTSILGASYAINSSLTVAAAAFTNKAKVYQTGASVFDFKGTQVGAGYQLNPAILLGLTFTTAEGSKMTNMQARYAFSKRTTAYAQYNIADNGNTLAFSPIAINSNTTSANQIDGCFNGTCGVLGARQNSFGLGVMHSF